MNALNNRVECYIEYGWDEYVIDPDGGMNCLRKLTSSNRPGSESYKLLQCMPSKEDLEWTNKLNCLPTITFGTIYHFLVSRKVFLKRVRDIEIIVDDQDLNLLNDEGSSDECWYESVEYTRALNKAYRFFKDGHVQDVKYHPWINRPDYICISSKVLPSMRKDRTYNVTIVIRETTARVAIAYCTCPAGLAGCCNHITATLYCLEDYVGSGLREEEELGCTSRLQTWNQPRKRNVEPRPTDDVILRKEVYGKKKRDKLHHVNKWDCRPSSRRIIDPDKARTLRESLCIIKQNKIDAANFAVGTASTEREREQALAKVSMMTSYGTSCFLQILDDDPAPLDDRKDEMRKERIARAEMKKKLFMQQLSANQTSVKHDHNYAAARDSSTPAQEIPTGETKDGDYEQQKLIGDLYNHHVCIDATAIQELELSTRGQHQSDRWHHERKLRVTASGIREICHQRPTTSCTAFVKRKFSSQSINTPAINYGRKHETVAISTYVKHQRSKGKFVQVELCGLFVDHSKPWLAASPDGIVTDFSELHHSKGTLEVKCPYVCERQTIENACKTVNGFCLTESKGQVMLSKLHAYYFQVQTQMHVTSLQWCDFFVWSPMGEPFIQRIKYEPAFMDQVFLKAQDFYFNKFLPTAVPHVIISPSDCTIRCSGPIMNEQCPFVDSVKPDNVMETKVKKFDHIDQQESSLRKQDKNLLCPDRQDPVVKANALKKFDLNGSIDEQEANEGIQAEKSVKKLCLKSLEKKDCDMRALNLGTLHHVNKQLAGVQKPGHICSQKQPCSDRKAFKIDNTQSSHNQNDSGVQLVTAYAKQTKYKTIQSVLKHLQLKRHVVKGDGSCLYHAIAHQAGLIASSSTGDEVVNNHLRQLTLLTMLNYPAIQLECSLSDQDWQAKQQQVLTTSEWGGDIELRLMAVGLKKDILVITDSSVGNVFARKYPYQPPPVPKMKGGVFIPVSSDELCSSEQSKQLQNCLIVVYNGSNHYDSTT